MRMFEKPLAASVSCVKNIMTPQLIAIREKKKKKKRKAVERELVQLFRSPHRRKRLQQRSQRERRR